MPDQIPNSQLRVPIVFFGSDHFSLPTLETLHKAGWPIKAVVTKPDSPSGRGRRLMPPPAKVWAEENSIPVLQPDKLRQAELELSKFGVQLSVVASYGKLIPGNILELFPLGLINVHPSLLPKYRGPAPIEAAILSGDTQTGVSLMRVSSEMDAGPIYVQTEYALTGQETQPELYDQLGRLGAQLLAEYLPDIAAGRRQPQPQDEGLVSVTKLIEKADGRIDWNQPAAQIERQIRAYLSWPGSRTTLFDREVLLTQAHVGPSHDPDLPPGTAEQTTRLIVIQTASGTLYVDRLKPAGKREMSAAEFLAGLRR